MSAKPQIIGQLGEQDLLLPQLVQAALAANDRLKVALTALQAAAYHADHPETAAESGLSPAQAAQIDITLADTVAAARRERDGTLHIPAAQRIGARMAADLAAMRAPIEQAGADPEGAFAERERQLMSALPRFEGDRVPGGLIGELTAIRPDAQGHAQDSVHRLVMDLHRALNALQGSLAEEQIEGAAAWRLTDADRTLVRVFMAGIEQTAALKFSHPGLGTTATRAGQRLIIENDIGTTDAHVLVIHVEGNLVSLTCADVHPQRLAFLRSLLEPFALAWNRPTAHPGQGLETAGSYLLAVGRFEAVDRAALERYLKFLGSRIVFLIDWNRARKRLRPFLAKVEAVRLLKWAADHDVGHRGFLEVGGERLLYEAIEFAGRNALRIGERLDEVLGPEAAFAFLQFVLQTASAGLLQGRSARFIGDEIKAELAGRLRSAQVNVFGVALRHAERVFDLATVVQDSLLGHAQPDVRAGLAQAAARARRWEQECDELVARVRALAHRNAALESYAGLMREADRAADALEEAMFLLTHLLTASAKDALVQSLQALATLLVAGAQESVKMFEAASHMSGNADREDLHDFFVAADRVTAIEHSADAAERSVTGALLEDATDARALFLTASVGRVLEEAADAFASTALRLRDQVLSEVTRTWGSTAP